MDMDRIVPVSRIQKWLDKQYSSVKSIPDVVVTENPVRITFGVAYTLLKPWP